MPLKINNIPFHIGAINSESNPEGIPNTLDFTLKINHQFSLLQQDLGGDVATALEKSYCFGKLIGTPLSDSIDGKPYADDFLNFLIDHSSVGNALEIGCGIGYLLKRLKEKSYKVIGIEPGVGYSPFWEKYNVDVVNDFFPSEKLRDNYDLIYGYMLLEHIDNLSEFINNISNILTEKGVAIFAVPDCTEEIKNSDPAILIHEHVSYFDEISLSNIFILNGMNARVHKSSYGRSLYVVAHKINNLKTKEFLVSNNEYIMDYLINVKNIIENKKLLISNLSKDKSVGIFCPSRALNILDTDLEVRFFDDDPYLYKKYLPPFKSPIENSEDLFKDPPEIIAIASRTFYKKISEKLRKGGFVGDIIKLY